VNIGQTTMLLLNSSCDAPFINIKSIEQTMCLITTQKEPLTAERDMTVYKSMQSGGLSLFQHFQYTPDKLYETKIRESKEWCAFDSLDTAWLDKNYPFWNHGNRAELKCLGRGFHSALKKSRLKEIKGLVVRCTIPKGSEDYLDATGLCVSNQIILHFRKKLNSEQEPKRSVATSDDSSNTAK
jgi:hypothetical protein